VKFRIEILRVYEVEAVDDEHAVDIVLVRDGYDDTRAVADVRVEPMEVSA
jgi:hypothetical protein